MESRNENLRVGYRPAREGYCTACGKSHGPILHVLAGNWLTRFCDDCLTQVVADAKHGRKQSSYRVLKDNVRG